MKILKGGVRIMKQIKQNEKGFTLVELVVVIAILAVLAALMVPRIIGSVEDAKRSSAIGDARTIASEIATYNAQEAAKDDGGDPIEAGTYDGSSGITELDLDADDMPDSEYVTIVVDEDGDVEVVIAEETS